MSSDTLAILAGGGPAPGMNAVINGVTLAALRKGWRVIGIRDGFKDLVKGDGSRGLDLTTEIVEGLEAKGGVFLGTSRTNPSKEPNGLENALKALEGLGVTKLVTIGGDDTATSALKMSEVAKGRIAVAHVPKTIDNDLDLPPGVPTFGFETAKDVGGRLVRNLRTDAIATSRWYVAILMGRSAGHLALHSGLAGGADVILIPEHYPAEKVPLAKLIEPIVEGVMAHKAGLAVLAEGLIFKLTSAELEELGPIEKDEHGNPRVSEVHFGDLVAKAVMRACEKQGKTAKLLGKEIGYELRCADPVGFDIVYGRTLGFAAVDHLASGGGPAMMNVGNGAIAPIPLTDLKDPKTGKARVRIADPSSPEVRAASTISRGP